MEKKFCAGKFQKYMYDCHFLPARFPTLVPSIIFYQSIQVLVGRLTNPSDSGGKFCLEHEIFRFLRINILEKIMISEQVLYL